MRKPKTEAKDRQDYKQLHSQSDVEQKDEKISPLASPIPPPEINHVPTTMINNIIKDAEQVSNLKSLKKVINQSFFKDSSKRNTRAKTGNTRRLGYHL